MYFYSKSILSGFVVLTCLSLTQWAGATVFNVNCDTGGSIQKTLLKLNRTGPNTIKVTGTCNENVIIDGLDRLTLAANPTATINDASGGAGNTITITESHTISITGFTVNGGNVGVFCGAQSSCVLAGNTIQGAGFAGVAIYEGSGLFSGQDVIQANLIGVLAQFGSFLQTQMTIVQNNTSFGIEAAQNSTLRLLGTKILGNASDGVHVEQNSSARIGLIAGTAANVIQRNGGNGVFVGDLSFVRFTLENKITGNLTQPDVSCNPQFSATRGALDSIGGGTTNCTEP